MVARVSAVQGKKMAEPRKATLPHEDLLEHLVHDLRNPLGVIAYFAEAIPTAAEGERDELCERLRVNAQRALHVLEEFALLVDLRRGQSRPVAQPWDARELVEELATEAEMMERRQGQVRRMVDVPRPLCVPRTHVACALRALLRETLRATAPEDGLDFTVRLDGRQALFQLTAPLRRDPELGTVARLPTDSIEVELAERVARLHGGRCLIEQRSGRGVITLALPAPRE